MVVVGAGMRRGFLKVLDGGHTTLQGIFLVFFRCCSFSSVSRSRLAWQNWIMASECKKSFLLSRWDCVFFFSLLFSFLKVGVPPSGPFDSFAFRIANRLVGNKSGLPALEVTANGPTLTFAKKAVIAWTGAEFPVKFNGVPLEPWKAVEVDAGTLTFGTLSPSTFGLRAYLAVAGGFKAEPYLGSCSSFPGGKLGGFSRLGEQVSAGQELEYRDDGGQEAPLSLPSSMIPSYGRSWIVGVVPGPQEAPDYLTPSDVESFYATTWKVSNSASKLGVRLDGGTKFAWARKDGGGGGSHPSNLHDNPYGIGSINFTGDHPVLLGVDGPSLGGFVCPATVPSSELSKFGQMKPLDTVQFIKISLEEAIAFRRNQEAFIETLKAPASPVKKVELPDIPKLNAVARKRAEVRAEGKPAVQYRIVGDRYVLVEYGDMVLDLNLRIRVHQLDEWLEKARIPGLVDRIPGVRTLLVEYDSQMLSPSVLLKLLETAELELGDAHNLKIPSRVLKLPLAFRDKWTLEAIDRYRTQIRQHAPYLPDNVDFTAECNGLANAEAVKQIVFKVVFIFIRFHFVMFFFL